MVLFSSLLIRYIVFCWNWITVLDLVSSINDLGVITNEKINFSEHVEIMVGKVFVILGFIRRLLSEFRDSYILKSLYTSLVRSKLEDAGCVWSIFYDMHVDKVKHVQKWLVQYVLRDLG
jgi:hypothetical protein